MSAVGGDVVVYLLLHGGRVAGVFTTLDGAQQAADAAVTWTPAEPTRWVTTDGLWVISARVLRDVRA